MGTTFTLSSVDPEVSHDSKDEIVAPHQTTLLKIADAYLIKLQSSSLPCAVSQLRRREIVAGLMPKYFQLSGFAQSSIRQSLGLQPGQSPDTIGASDTAARRETSDSDPLRELDLLLPKVGEALVLVLQCFSTACLSTGGPAGEATNIPESDTPRNLLLNASSASDGIGLVEHSVGSCFHI